MVSLIVILVSIGLLKVFQLGSLTSHKILGLMLVVTTKIKSVSNVENQVTIEKTVLKIQKLIAREGMSLHSFEKCTSEVLVFDKCNPKKELKKLLNLVISIKTKFNKNKCHY